MSKAFTREYFDSEEFKRKLLNLKLKYLRHLSRDMFEPNKNLAKFDFYNDVDKTKIKKIGIKRKIKKRKFSFNKILKEMKK